MNTREFLDQREAELVAQIAPLREQLHPLERELAALRRAKGAVGMERVELAAPDIGAVGLTMKQMAVKALSEHFPRGATTRDMLGFIHDGYGRGDITRESLSPQLTRLLRAGVIKRIGNRWAVAKIN